MFFGLVVYRQMTRSLILKICDLNKNEVAVSG